MHVCVMCTDNIYASTWIGNDSVNHTKLCYGETILVNTYRVYMGITTNVHSKVYKRLCRQLTIMKLPRVFFLSPRDSDRIVLLLKQYYYLLL